jgi:shikimate kinase
MQKNDKKIISFIGYRGTGKSTISQEISKITGLPLISIDEEIVKYTKKDISAIIKEKGWDFFREIEKEILSSTLQNFSSPYIIDCGGGIILKPENRLLLKEYCFNIYLTASPYVIYERLKKDTNIRPSLTKKPLLQEIIDTLTEREPLYKEVSNLTINTENKTIKEIITEIMKAIQTLRILL